MVNVVRKLAVAVIACSVAAQGAAAATLFEIRVQGNTLLPQAAVERSVYPFLGPVASDSPMARLGEAAAALESAYRERGFPTVGVAVAAEAEAELEYGFATLQVFEQRVDRLRVTGARYFRNAQVREALPSVRQGRVLDTTAMQEQLDRLSARSNDLTVRPVIKAGRAPGLLDVELQVRDELPLHGVVELNNFASANTSDLRLSATLTYANLFQRQDSLSLGFQTAPENREDVEVLSATYLYRPRDSRAILAMTAVTSDSEVSAVGNTTVLGEGEFLITRAILPLRARSKLRDSLIFGIDYKSTTDITNFSRDVLDDLVRDEQTARKIDYFNFTAGYNLTHEWLGGTNGYAAEAHFGLRGFGNDRDEFETKRFKGEPNYLFLKLQAQRDQPLPWLDLSATTKIRAQLTSDQLVGNEQLGLGGVNSVRGYLETEELADYGVLASLQINTAGLRLDRFLGMPLEGFAFWDWGAGWLNEPLPDEDSQITLASLGVGARVDDFFGFNTEAGWAYILRDATDTQSGDDSVFFRVSYGF